MVFDKNLNFLTQFGGAGLEAGQFDEPVGIAVSSSGLVAVADTWNRRVQVFESDESGLIFTPTSSFDVEAWYGTGIENKPYITFSPYDTILISDPDGDRVLEFTIEGEYVRGIQDLAYSLDTFSAPYGLDFDQNGKLWVSDASSNMVLKFDLGAGE
jgi:DNA-binding beta-propeller fold protein YncE